MEINVIKHIKNVHSTQSDSIYSKNKKNFLNQLLGKEQKIEEHIGFENALLTDMYFQRYLFIDTSCMQLSLVATVLSLLYWSSEFNQINEHESIVILYIIFLSTMLLVICIIIRDLTKLQFLIKKDVISDKSNLINSGLWKPLLLEFIIVILHPSPFLWGIQINFMVEGQHVYMHVNEIMIIITLIRVIFIAKSILMKTIWYSNQCHRVCNMYSVNVDILFVVKCLMKKTPLSFVTILLFSSVFYFGFAVTIAEAPMHRDEDGGFKLYSTGVWMMIVTMLTVGYGDYYPQTNLGRFITFLGCFWGVFIVSLMVITLNNLLSISSLEENVFVLYDRLKAKEEVNQYAASMVVEMIKLIQDSKFHDLNYDTKMQVINQLKIYIQNLKIVKRQYDEIGNQNLKEEMIRQFELLRDLFNTFKQDQIAIMFNILSLMNYNGEDQNKLDEIVNKFVQVEEEQLLKKNQEIILQQKIDIPKISEIFSKQKDLEQKSEQQQQQQQQYQQSTDQFQLNSFIIKE